MPGIFDLLAAGKPASYRLDVEQADGQDFAVEFDPQAYWADAACDPGRPLPARG